MRGLNSYYLSARSSRAGEMRRNRLELRSHIPGTFVTSRWVDSYDSAPAAFSAQWLEHEVDRSWVLAYDNLQDILAAKTFVMFTESSDVGFGGKGARHTELGFAIANDKRIVIIGQRENAYQCYPLVELHETWDKFILAETLQKTSPIKG